jgi:c-di-GMP-related signal transduction protein
MNITDEGIQKLSYELLGSDNPLNAFQQSMLRTAAGVQFFTDQFMEKFIGQVGKRRC